MPPHLRLGTRGSVLALRQAELVREALLACHPGLAVELAIITTHGDRAADVPLHRLSGQGVFARAIEEALLAGTVDLAVHSLKDLPAAERPGLLLAAFPPREDARDALVCRGRANPVQSGARSSPSDAVRTGVALPSASTSAAPSAAAAAGPRLPSSASALAALPSGARVATGSPRRAAQLLAARPDLQIVDIRGNLDTRLRKLETEGLDALVLAVAGLRRLGLADRITEALPVALCLPAVGQGALAVQCRADDATTSALLAPLDDAPTRAAVETERALLATLGGGCKVPIAAHAALHDGELRLDALIAAPDGQRLVRDRAVGPTAAPAALGGALAERLLAAGGAALIQDERRTTDDE